MKNDFDNELRNIINNDSMSKNSKLIRKWFPFLNSWHLSDEPKMLRMIKKRCKEAELFKELGINE